MAIEVDLESCFRPEERKRGEDLFARGTVLLAGHSDTDARASIKASGAPRVHFETDDITSAAFRARCSCPTGAKGVLCKHAWATVLALDAKDADFLNDKREAEALGRENPFAAKRAAQNARARDRAKEMRRARKAAEAPRAPRTDIHPDPVVEALAYFRDNGFDLTADLEMAPVLDAKRALARVFHPDRGGTHDEAITLNFNFEILREYLNG